MTRSKIKHQSANFEVLHPARCESPLLMDAFQNSQKFARFSAYFQQDNILSIFSVFQHFLRSVVLEFSHANDEPA